MSPYQHRAPYVVLALSCAALVGAATTAAVRWAPSAEPTEIEVSRPAAAPAPPPAPRPPRPARKSRAARSKKLHAAKAVSAAPQAEAPLPLPPMLATEPAPAPVEAVEAVALGEPEGPPDEAAALTFDGNGEEVASAIARAKRRAVQACFEHALKRDPKLEGTVNVELELTPPSQVNAVRVSDDLERPELTACIAAAMQRLSFTGLNEEVTVQVPYRLSARGK